MFKFKAFLNFIIINKKVSIIITQFQKHFALFMELQKNTLEHIVY